MLCPLAMPDKRFGLALFLALVDRCANPCPLVVPGSGVALTRSPIADHCANPVPLFLPPAARDGVALYTREALSGVRFAQD